MGIIFVDELGEVEIEGDVPTPDEADLILQTIEAVERQRGAAPSPAPMAAQPAALYPTMESAIAADVAREAEQAPSTLVGGAVQGVSQVGRGLFEAPFVAAEALGVPTGQLGEEAEKFAQSWREEEAKAFRPSVSLEEAEGLEYGTWVAESLARMVPGMAAAMASMPAYAVSLVADTARERARADGRDEVNVGDLAAAAASSGFIAASERLGAKVALGGKLPKVAQRMTQTAPGRIAAAAGTEAATEVAQEAVQYGAERLGTEAGARWEELGPRLKEAAVLAPIVGGGIRGATETARAVRDRPATVPEVEVQEVDARLPLSDFVTIEMGAARKASLAKDKPENFLEPSPGEPFRLYRGLGGGARRSAEGVDFYSPSPWVALEYSQKLRDPEVDERTEGSIVEYQEGADPRVEVIEVIPKRVLDTSKEIPAPLAKSLLESDVPRKLVRGVMNADGLRTINLGELQKYREVFDIVRSHGYDLVKFTDYSIGGRDFSYVPVDPSIVQRVATYDTKEGGGAVEAEAVIEERDPNVPGEYTEIASPLQVEAVDVQLEAKKSAEAIEELQESIKRAEAPVPPPAPRPTERPLEFKPRQARKVPDFVMESLKVLRAANPETAEQDLLRASLIVAGQKRRADTPIRDDEFAAQNRYIDANIEQIAPRLGMTEGDVRALLPHEKVSYAQTMQQVGIDGLDATLTADGVTVPAKLKKVVKVTGEGSYAPTATEEAAMTSLLMLQRKHHSNLIDTLDPEASSSRRDLKESEQDILDTLVALRRSGTELARAFRFRQFLVNPEMDLIQAQAQATILKGGELDAKTKERLSKLWEKAEQIEADAKRVKKSAMAKLEAARKRLEDASAIEAASKDVSKKARKQAAEAAAAEADVEVDVEAEVVAEPAAKPPVDLGIFMVKPLRKSKEQRDRDREMRDAQKDVDEAMGEVVAAESDIKRARRLKSESPTTATRHMLLNAYDNAFGKALALTASSDLSAFGRQGLPLVLSNPYLGYKTAKTMTKYMLNKPWSKAARLRARDMQTEMLSSPFQKIRDMAGLEMTEVEGVTNVHGGPMETKEDAYAFRAFESGLLSDSIVRPSENTFGLTLNELRSKNFDAVVTQMAEARLDEIAGDTDKVVDLDAMKPEQRVEAILKVLTPQDIEQAARFINVISGRGRWTSGAGIWSDMARRFMFAPKFTLSRIEAPWQLAQLYASAAADTKAAPAWTKDILETGNPYANMSPAARKALIKRVNKVMSLYASLFVLTAVAAGDEDDKWQDNIKNFFNPNEGSFLKARVGDYHFDMLAGVPATTRHLIPMLLVSEDIVPEGYSENFWKWASGVVQLANTKAAPLLSGIRTLAGYNWRGGEIKTEEELAKIGKGIGLTSQEINDLEGPIATAMYRAIRAFSDAAVPITLENAAIEFWKGATTEEKAVIERAVPLFLEAYGFGISDFEPSDKKKQRKSRRKRVRGQRDYRRAMERYR